MGPRACAQKCFASKRNRALVYLDMSPDANWLQTMVSQKHFEDNEIMTPIMRIPGMHVDGIAWDIMHVLYLGIGKDAAGSAIACLVLSGSLGSMDASLLHTQVPTCIHNSLILPRPGRCHVHDFPTQILNSRGDNIDTFTNLGTS